MRNFKTGWSLSDDVLGHMEHGDPVSVTLPDESYSIQELLDKFSTGLDPGVFRQPSFDDGADFSSPDLEKLRDSDLVDKEEYSRELRGTIASQERVIVTKNAAEKAASDVLAMEAEELKAELKVRRAERKQAAGGTGPNDKGTAE